MATASKVQLGTDVGDWPEYYRTGITKEQTECASELLQKNHKDWHIFFQDGGLHNHIAHHVLAIWALNASTEQIQKNYETNESYQRSQPPVNQEVLEELQDPAGFLKNLNPRDNYHTFLRFFQDEIDKGSWQEVLQKYVFAGDDRAEAMFVRLFAGFLHPFIHLGYGVEFRQPAIVAEALAQASCHDDQIGKLLLPAEKAARESRGGPSKSIVELLDTIHGDKDMQAAAHWDDGNKIYDGIIPRAGERMTELAAQFHVKPDELNEKTAEMTNAVCYYTAGAQHPPNMVMFDFYYMHCVNSSIFFPAFLKQAWLSDQNKARLLEWKTRLDLAMYASRKCPDIRLDEIREYKPRHQSGWDGIQDRVCDFNDDGHSAKLIRALAHGQSICKPYEHKDEFRIKHDDWLLMGHMAIDSVENTKTKGVSTWVRSAGFDEAWKDIPLRAQL
ncbi:uncharacterized protein LTR77_010167 [Saxophila tyrrhenica]|uniref:HypA n=1 Tax=Saxophila tyrrhenica TaxID=1690608 RepID=A0AAV9NWB9_9PEZI|nr:hypothetical protein LTR77_010167 [Saxophila tyrrhenica]